MKEEETSEEDGGRGGAKVGKQQLSKQDDRWSSELICWGNGGLESELTRSPHPGKGLEKAWNSLIAQL